MKKILEENVQLHVDRIVHAKRVVGKINGVWGVPLKFTDNLFCEPWHAEADLYWLEKFNL